MIIEHTWRPILGVLAVSLLLTGKSLGQDPAPPADAEQGDAVPSLDELLGIEEDEQDDSAHLAEEEAEAELQRRLSGAELESAFDEAIEKMRISASRLDEAFDPGLGTQRVQESILAKLDQLIDEARNQQQSSSSRSSSQSQSQPQEQPSPPQQDPGKQQRTPGESEADRQAGQPQDGQEADPPGPESGELNSMFEESRSEWGSLPERFRDELLQGRSDRFSPLYERLTRAYYRRLAEESSP